MNCVLGFVLTLVFIFCGVLAANTVSFYTHYGNATEYKSFLQNAADNLQLSVEDGNVYTEQVVNTSLSESDAKVYGSNGYTLIVDTRSSFALDDFEAYCILKNGEQEITYNEYLALPNEQKSDYDFKLRYTPNELTLTDELVSGYENYLSAHEDESVKKQYAELVSVKNDLSADDYALKVYTLYIQTYYPDISAYERAGDVPLLRSYYYRNYLNSNDIRKSTFVFADVLFGFFDTDGGLSVTFYGSYTSAESGVLSADKVDGFIKDVFRSSVSTSANIYLMNTCKYIPLIAFIPFVLALLMKLFFVIKKNEQQKKLSLCIKIECSYLAVSSLLTALAVFVCGFFVSSNTLNVLPLIIYGGVLAVRTIVFLVTETLLNRKVTETEKDDGEPSPEI